MPVHLFNGVFGTICVGLFAVDKITGAATGNGLFNGGGMTLLIAQLKGIVRGRRLHAGRLLDLLVRRSRPSSVCASARKRKKKAWTSASTARSPTSVSRTRETAPFRDCGASRRCTESPFFDRRSAWRPLDRMSGRASRAMSDAHIAATAVVMLSGREVRPRLRSSRRRCFCCWPGASWRCRVWLLAAEVLATILGLFLFGSFRYQIHKNALTYGMLLVIVATFCGLPTSAWHVEIAERGLVARGAASTCCRSPASTI